MKRILRFLRDEDGPTAVEYSVMLALVLLAMLATIGALGGQTGTLWGNSTTRMSDAGLGS